MSDPVSRVAVVGCGRWGGLIVADRRSLGAEIVTVDLDAAREPDVSSIDHAGSVDAVVVATPASSHAEVLRSLAPLDVPVLCEKPLAASVADAEEVVRLLGDRLRVLHVWRYHPGVELLGDLARDGTSGEVHGLRTVRDTSRS